MSDVISNDVQCYCYFVCEWCVYISNYIYHIYEIIYTVEMAYITHVPNMVQSATSINDHDIYYTYERVEIEKKARRSAAKQSLALFFFLCYCFSHGSGRHLARTVPREGESSNEIQTRKKNKSQRYVIQTTLILGKQKFLIVDCAMRRYRVPLFHRRRSK